MAQALGNAYLFIGVKAVHTKEMKIKDGQYERGSDVTKQKIEKEMSRQAPGLEKFFFYWFVHLWFTLCLILVEEMSFLALRDAFIC